MTKANKLHLLEFQTNNPKLFQCLLFVKKFVAINSTITDSYVLNGNYFVHYKDAHPYFEGLVKPTISSMFYCEDYMHLQKVEITKEYIKVALKKSKNTII